MAAERAARGRSAGDCDRGNVGHHGNVGNINVVGNVSDVGRVDNFRDAGHFGIVGNVRLRLKQHCCIVDSNVNVAHSAGRRGSNGNSLGFYGDQQSWGQLRGSGTDDRRIAHCGHRGAECSATNNPHYYSSGGCVIHNDKRFPLSNHRASSDVEHSKWLLDILHL